jgi:uncharacterized protein with FMN-binding domain
MRARAIAGGIVSSAAILVVGWQIGSAQVTASTSTTTPAAGSESGTSSGTPASPTSPSTSTEPSASPSTGKSSSASGTFTGSTSQTQYGPMQVEIVVSAGKITDVKALQVTDEGGRSAEISNYATPILRTEALKAQSAKIQSVSGATYTSQGYISSLQSAIDKAGL